MPTKQELDKWAELNQIDMTNPDVEEGWNGQSMDLRQKSKLPRQDYDFKDHNDIDSQEEIDAELGSKFGGGQFGGHGASGSWDETMKMPEMKLTLSDKARAKVKSMKQPVEDTETSLPITSGIDKIMAAYRSGDKNLAKAGIGGKLADKGGDAVGKDRAAIEAAFQENPRRTDGMKFEANKKYDPTADYAAIDHGAAIASGVKWDPSDHQMRAKQNENKEKNRLEEFDRNYRTAHDADTFDERNADRRDARKTHSEDLEANRANSLLMAREKAKDGAERAAADRALRAELANGNNALRAEMMRMRHEDAKRDRELRGELGHEKEDEKNIQKAGKDLEDVSRMEPDLKTLKDQVDSYDRHEGMDGFGLWDSTKPEFLQSQDEINVRQGSLRNIAKILLQNSGKTVSDKEVERTLGNYGLGSMKTEKSAAQGLKAMLRDAEIVRSTRSGKYSPKILKELEDRSGGVYSTRQPNGQDFKESRLGPSNSGEPAPAQKFTAPEEEDEYQAWKAQHGGR
jgi:hypothetical protein